MSKVSPEFSNRRLNTVKFMNDSDIPLFEDLRLQVLGLCDPDEKVPAVYANEAGAWAKLFSVYQTLKKRRAVADSDPVGVQQAANNAQTERDWNSHLQTRVELLEYLKRESVSKEMLEYCGLEESDLDEPTVQGDERFSGCRHPDWRGRSSRISTAWWKIRNMGLAERMNIPNVMQTRRLVDAVNEIQERLKAVEQKLKVQEVSPPNTAGMALVGLRH
jgi:hypothetical protein